jgi:hypothetical protein
VTDYYADISELPTVHEIRAVHDALDQVFLLEGLGYFPDESHTRADVANWPAAPGFPVFLDARSDAADYRAYTSGVAFGRVRILSSEELAAAGAGGSISFQDIVMLSHAPRDINSVVAALITAGEQSELSHLALRMARRGTPNELVADALSAFEGLDDRFVRLDIDQTGYSVREASLEEAQEFWRTFRPRVSDLPTFDDQYFRVDRLSEIDLDGSSLLEPPYGGKASHFARLQPWLTGPFERYRPRASSEFENNRSRRPRSGDRRTGCSRRPPIELRILFA